MTLTLRQVVDDDFSASTMSQTLVVTRLKELASEGDALAADIRAATLRIAQIKTVVPELLLLLEDMPDEGCSDPAHFGGSCD